VASSWLAPSYPTRPCDLPVQKTRDASNRRLPPKRLACTRISCAPGFLSRLSSWGHPAESKALRGSTGGPNGSRRLDRFGGLSLRVCLVRSASRLSRHERGRFLPTTRGSIEPLTSLSLLPVHHVAHVAFARACSVRRPAGRAYEVIVMGKLPSLPSTPARDDRRLPTNQDAFPR
jgi:hypothetical protein